MPRSILAFWGLCLLAVAGMYAWRLSRPDEQGSARSGASDGSKIESLNHPVGRFTLTERSGEPFDSASLDGDVWIASFFFTSCPGVCLRLNSAIAQLQSELDDSIRFVSITVDATTDTPEKLRKYADHYQADAERWLFLTGEAEEIRRIANEGFLVSGARETHSDRLIVVDRQGRIRGAYRGTEETQIRLLKRKVAALLSEPADRPPS